MKLNCRWFRFSIIAGIGLSVIHKLATLNSLTQFLVDKCINNVVAVSRRLLSTVSSFTLYGNPVYCDCRLHWLLTDECSDAESLCSHRLLSYNRTYCAGPAIAAGLSLLESLASDIDDNATSCGPVVTALFEPVMYLPIASRLHLDCRISELSSQSSILWITPGRRRRLRIEKYFTGTVLIIRHLESRDAGTYRCIAIDLNTNASSSAKTVLRLYNVDARVLPIFVGTTSIMITWSGTDSTFAAADYVIVYRLFSVNNHSDAAARKTDSGAIHLRPYLRKYAINDLRARMTYEFCITTPAAENDWITLHCTQLTTKPEVSLSTTTINGRLVGVLLVAVVITVLLLRCSCVRQRGAYRAPNGTTAGGHRSSSSSLLPLNQLTGRSTDTNENVISSRTSLIGPCAVNWHCQTTYANK